MSIPVICDRCRSTGIAGESDFTHLGDLLEFTPVPHKKERVDGWSAERQRAFIAAVSATGSKRRAAQLIGMAPFGVDQMLKAEGNDSFKAAYERAMAIAAQNGSMKIAQGVADAAARNAQLAAPRASAERRSPARSSTSSANGKTKPRASAARSRRRTASRRSCCAPAASIFRKSARAPASAPRSRS